MNVEWMSNSISLQSASCAVFPLSYEHPISDPFQHPMCWKVNTEESTSNIILWAPSVEGQRERDPGSEYKHFAFSFWSNMFYSWFSFHLWCSLNCQFTMYVNILYICYCSSVCMLLGGPKISCRNLIHLTIYQIFSLIL